MTADAGGAAYDVDVEYCILCLGIAVNKNKMVFGISRNKKDEYTSDEEGAFSGRSPGRPVEDKKTPRTQKGPGGKCRYGLGVRFL